MDKIFARTLKTLFWDFLSSPSQADQKFFSKTGIKLFLLCDEKLYGGKKTEKTDDPEILHYRQMEK